MLRVWEAEPQTCQRVMQRGPGDKMLKALKLVLNAWLLGPRELTTIKGQLTTSMPPSCPEALSSIACILKGVSQMAMVDVNQSIEEELAAAAPMDLVSSGDALHPSSHRLATQVHRGHCLATVDIDVLRKKLLEVEDAILCPTRDIFEHVEVRIATFNPRNVHAKISELCNGEEVNLTLDTQGMEDMVAKGRAGHHEAGIALHQRPHIICCCKSDVRNLPSHPTVITPNPFWGCKLQA